MNKHWSLASEANRKDRANSLWFYLLASPIVVFFGFTNFGTEPFPFEDLWILVVPIFIVACIAIALRKAVKGEEKTEIELRYDEGLAIFRNYRFITKFTGNKVQEEVSVPFSGIYKSKITRGRGNNVWLELVTNHGKVSVGSFVELPEIIECIDQIVKLNEEENSEFTNDLRSAPTPRTPWYGWVMLAIGVFAVAYISWSYLKNT